MAAALGNSIYLQQFTGRTDLPQAAAVVMQYTGYTDANSHDAPTYACVGTADGIASWRTMRDRLQRLEGMGIDTEFHAYERLPHGFGLGTGSVAEGWHTDAVRFWERQMRATPVEHTQAKEDRSTQDIYSTEGIRLPRPRKGLNIINHKKTLL